MRASRTNKKNPDMAFSLSWFIARRYLFQKRSVGFITIISYFSILGLLLGVASLVTTLSILNGFEQTLERAIIRFEAPLRVRAFHRDDIANSPELIAKVKSLINPEALRPYVEKEALFRAGDVAEGILVHGVSQENQASFRLPEMIVEGKLRLSPSEVAASRGIIVGQDLANRMEVSVGQRVFLINTQSMRGVMTQPLVKPFEVTGIFNSGLYEYDNAYVFIELEAAQELFQMAGMISGLEISLADPVKADEAARLLENELSYPYYAQSWKDLHRTLFAWMKSQSLPILVIFGMIVVVGIFNLVSTLIMIVVDKRRAVGILRAVGISAWKIIAVFFYQGAAIGFAGVMLGTLTGFGLCWLQDTFGIYSLNKEIYFVGTLPVSMHIEDFLLVGGTALVICFLATLYPAYRAAKLPPTDAIRFD